MYKKIVASTLFFGLLLGAVGGWFSHAHKMKQPQIVQEDKKKDSIKIVGQFVDGADSKFFLSDGRTIINPNMMKSGDKINRVNIDNRWLEP